MRNTLRNLRIAPAILIAVLSLTLVACGGKGLSTPDLTIDTYQGEDVLGGNQVKLSDLVGHGKPVVVNFYAALCPPCRAEMPDFEAIYQQRGETFTLVGVDVGPQEFLGSRDEGKALLSDLNITYPAGTTYETSVVSDFELVAMPTTLFIRADGTLLKQFSGLLSAAKISEYLDQLTAN